MRNRRANSLTHEGKTTLVPPYITSIYIVIHMHIRIHLRIQITHKWNLSLRLQCVCSQVSALAWLRRCGAPSTIRWSSRGHFTTCSPPGRAFCPGPTAEMHSTPQVSDAPCIHCVIKQHETEINSIGIN